MTVIAFDGQVLAADSAATDNNDGMINRVCKIGAVEPDGPIPLIGHPPLVLFGVAGRPEDLALVHQFLLGETDTLNLKKSQALIVAHGGAFLWQGSGPVQLIKGAKAAIGGGAQAALAAMFAGVGAVRAVEIATAVVDCCEGPVQALSLPGPVEGPPTADPPVLHEVGGTDQ